MKLLDQLRSEIRVRHYSIRTEHTYADWVVRFVRFHGMRHPKDMGGPEINRFLTHLACEGNVAASTQNQALAAVLFLYKTVLKKDVGELGEVIRAKKPERLPVVLSVEETEKILAQLRGNRPDKPLSERSIERIVRRLALDAGLLKDVCCMTLRHSYAVTRLRHGAGACQVQKDLGHRSIKTTLRYQRYILPTDFVSPADRISSQALGLKHVAGNVTGGASSVPDVGSQVPSVSPAPSSLASCSSSPLSPTPTLHDPSASIPVLAPEFFRADALELPFPEISSRAREFYALLKTCIKDRYLALRSSRSPMAILERSRVALRRVVPVLRSRGEAGARAGSSP